MTRFFFKYHSDFVSKRYLICNLIKIIFGYNSHKQNKLSDFKFTTLYFQVNYEWAEKDGAFGISKTFQRRLM